MHRLSGAWKFAILSDAIHMAREHRQNAIQYLYLHLTNNKQCEAKMKWHHKIISKLLWYTCRVVILSLNSVLNFREHEWSKHGTCATSLGATGDQHKYFAKALEMKSKYDAGKYVTLWQCILHCFCSGSVSAVYIKYWNEYWNMELYIKFGGEDEGNAPQQHISRIYLCLLHHGSLGAMSINTSPSFSLIHGNVLCTKR